MIEMAGSEVFRRPLELAPDAIYLPVSSGVYGEYAEKVREIAARYSELDLNDGRIAGGAGGYDAIWRTSHQQQPV